MTWALPWGGERKLRFTAHPPLPIWPFRRRGKSLNCLKRLVFPTRLWPLESPTSTAWEIRFADTLIIPVCMWAPTARTRSPIIPRR